ncbi:MAG: YgiQ family radical SAM protein, partial [Chrysiogenales bacterium]
MFDVILVLPYPFADHPSFPEGILKRAMESAGFSVGVIETPFWQDRESFAVLGRPRLFFAVVSGPLDSVVLNYTANRRRRREDLYQFEGAAFFSGRPPDIKFKIRPDRTLTVFCNRLREVFR